MIYMFSPITIPSSTRIPITMIIPNRDNTLIVTPRFAAKMNIPKKEIGNPAATQNAILTFRKSERKSRTRMIPIIAFSVNNCVL